METNCLGPDANEAIYRHEHNRHACRVKHGFGADIISTLNEPICIHACGLCSYRDEKKVGKNEAVESLDFVLKSGNNGDGRIEGIAQEEVYWILSLRRL